MVRALIAAGVFGLAALSAVPTGGDAAMVVRADFSKTTGPLRPLQGINKGPLIAGGLLDISQEQAALHPPYNRLHDCRWPQGDVVDIHAVFPNPAADPGQPGSYDFRETDEYIAAVRATGARVIYRLGESIEHTTRKRWVNPPADPARWAQVAIGIIRHYNEGWASGYHWDIRHWEVWNEPENRPACWTGTDAQFMDLYVATARAIKERFPNLQVGGPGIGYTGRLEGEQLKEAGFLEAFLAMCRDRKAPLDFLSWHCYTADPTELVRRARGVRALLDTHGFTRTQTHLTEWNYLPGNSWDGFGKSATAKARHRFISEMSSARGAAFTASALVLLQEAPVDVSCFYHGEIGQWGVLGMEGVPEPNYYSLLWFGELAGMPARARVTVEGAVTAAACVDGKRAARVLAARQGEGPARLRVVAEGLPWPGATAYEVLCVDGSHTGERVAGGEVANAAEGLPVEMDGAGVVLVRLTPAK